MIYLYAIGEGAAGVREPGVDGRPVESFRHGRLTAFVSRGVRSAVAPDPVAFRSHDRVASALMDGAAILPMRFGTVVEDDGHLRTVLDERGAELEASLDRVRGRVELGIRALWSPRPDRAVPESGREFMLAKLERREAARRVADAVHRPLAQLAAEASCSLLPRSDTALTGAYLVDRARVAELERRAAALGSTDEPVEVVLTGPWPPYGFCEPHHG